MCPSYRVTRDEMHLTRGRANTLRLALSGQLGPHAFTSDAMHQTMALCVGCKGCKGCKRECPTGVDMVRLKVEFLHHYKARHGYTLKDHVVAHLPAYARFASRVPFIFNLRNRWPGLARAMERWLGFPAQRRLPEWRRDTFWQRAPRLGLATRAEVLAASKGVVLFVDTFNGNFESGNAVAVLTLLQAAGYAVHVAQRRGAPVCCGRTYLAAGMVAQARAKARDLLDTFLPFADAGLYIVGLEPSCLFTLRDEMRVMGLGDAAERVATKALMFDEFIAREASAGRFAPTLRAPARPVFVHGHCHQKAFGAIDAVMQVLSLLPDCKPQLIESSCCGMAGSFGFEAQHLEVSMQMAELTLLPALRAAPADAIVVADGSRSSVA